MDGANDFIIWGRIILPLCKPVLATVGLFVAVGQWNAFMDTYLYAKELPTLQYVLYQIMETATIKVDPHLDGTDEKCRITALGTYGDYNCGNCADSSGISVPAKIFCGRHDCRRSEGLIFLVFA